MVIDLRDSCPRLFRGFKRRCLEVHRPFLEEKRADIGQKSKKKATKKKKEEKNPLNHQFIQKGDFSSPKKQKQLLRQILSIKVRQPFSCLSLRVVAPTSGSQWFGKSTTGGVHILSCKGFCKNYDVSMKKLV